MSCSPSSFRSGAVALGLHLGFAATLGAASLQAAFAAETAVQRYRIAAGPLGPALALFATQSGVPLAFDAELAEGRQTAGLDGEYSLAGGFSALLAGSGLQAMRGNDGGWSLQSVPRVDTGITQLQAVQVQADVDRETATGPVDGYVVKRSATGTKTDTALLEVPQSISVVTADEIRLLKPPSLLSALAYTSGVGIDAGGPQTQGDSFTLRGFRALAYYNSLYRNGMKFTVNVFDGSQEPYGLERIEVLKGASSLLYGTAAPGGIINTVSKQPTVEPIREINVDVGSFDRKQASADFSGALSEDGTWAARLTLLARDADTYVDHVADDRLFAAPSVRWQPSENTSLTLLGYWQRDDSAYTGGYQAQMFFGDDSLGPPSRHAFYGQPGISDYRSDRYVAGYLFEHRFSDQLRLRHALNGYEAHTDYGFADVYAIDDDQRTGLRYAQTRRDRAKALTTDSSLEMRVQTGLLTHRLLVGADTTRQDFSTERYSWSIGAIDLYEPDYGNQASDPQRNGGSGISRADRYGLYVQDQAKLGERWIFVTGGRQEWSEYRDRPMFSPDDYPASNEKDDAFTWRGGLVLLAGNGLAPFFSYSTSYEPTPGRNRGNQRFVPSTGDQFELGLRYQPQEARVLLSAALYELTQQNVLTPDPVDRNYSVQTGEVRSRGLELEARAQLARGFTLIGSYSYTDARTMRSNNPDEIGDRTINVPYHQLSLWTGYDVRVAGIGDFSAGAGTRYTADRPGSPGGEPYAMPNVALLDLMLAYSSGPWRLSVNATNLTDKAYLETCSYACTYGEPRRVLGTLSYRW